jgi:hypothetical protein
MTSHTTGHQIDVRTLRANIGRRKHESAFFALTLEPSLEMMEA